MPLTAAPEPANGRLNRVSKLPRKLLTILPMVGESLEIQNSYRATSCMKRADFAEVIRPNAGELNTGRPCESAITLKDVFGALKFVWFRTLNASARICRLSLSAIVKRRATERSRFTSLGSRVVFRPRVPTDTGSTSVRLAPVPVNKGPVGTNGKLGSLGETRERTPVPSEVRAGEYPPALSPTRLGRCWLVEGWRLCCVIVSGRPERAIRIVLN